ncbi:MAG: methyltransferase domain-containing protein [Anaerolineales bacterium]
MNLRYLIPRFIRHVLPEKVVRFLLLRKWIIRPGLETREPQSAVERYQTAHAERGLSLQGKRIMVFGYGGRFDIGLALLDSGVGGAVMLEKYAPPDDAHNRLLLPRYEQYLSLNGREVRPAGSRLSLLEADVRDLKPVDIQPFDLIVSNSVYEHLEDVEGTTRALSVLTKPDGLHIHFVDLRDHFFKYPFEMLAYSEQTWRRWLNPSSNHNRYRIWDYRKVFEGSFDEVEITVLQRDEAGFRKARPRIRSEFISGDLSEDAVTHIRIVAAKPKIRL